MLQKLFALTFLFSLALGASKNSVVNFRSLKCTVSDVYVYKNFTCIMRHNGRDSTSLIGLIFFKEALYEFNVKFLRFSSYFFDLSFVKYFKFEAILMYKGASVFRELGRVPPTEWCNLVKSGTTNVLYYQVFKILEAGEPGLMHTCPYTVCKSIIVS